jgi:hypothetical protein
MRWSILTFITFLGGSSSFAQADGEKAAPGRASLKLDNLAAEVVPADRPGEVLVTINQGEAASRFEIPKLSGTITKLSACPWDSGRGIAIAIEARAADAPRWSYHWLTIDIRKADGKVGLKLAGASSEAFLSDLPHEHAVSITNPRSDTIHVLLTQKDPRPPAAIGYLYVHDCPVGAFGAKGSAYAKLHELRAREVGTGQ